VKRKVLLVDDEPGLAIALRVVLEAENLDCEAVTDMSAALRYLEANEVAVLVTDIMMPPGEDFAHLDSSETGFHLISKVKERWPRLPVICLSVIGNHAKLKSLMRMNVRFLRKGETPLDTAVKVIKRAALGVVSF
jgi:DNA-binding NarL/FixJ family response regulator